MQRAIFLFVLVLGWCVSTTTYGQTITEYDINQSGFESNSVPKSFVEMGSSVYYTATDAIDLTGRAKGVYFLRLTGNSINYTTKLVIR